MRPAAVVVPATGELALGDGRGGGVELAAGPAGSKYQTFLLESAPSGRPGRGPWTGGRIQAGA